MKSIAAATLLIFGAALFAEGTTVTFTSANLFGGTDSFSLYDSFGVALKNGDLVRVGFFADPAALSPGLSLEQMASLGGWSEFGTTAIASPFGQPAKIYNSVTNNSAAATFFNNKEVYLWVFDDATAAAATSTGIFRAVAAEVPWRFPTNAFGFNDGVTLNVDEASMRSIGGIGSVDFGQDRLNLAIVPEPSAGLLVGIALVGAFGSRRRRRA